MMMITVLLFVSFLPAFGQGEIIVQSDLDDVLRDATAEPKSREVITPPNSGVKVGIQEVITPTGVVEAKPLPSKVTATSTSTGGAAEMHVHYHSASPAKPPAIQVIEKTRWRIRYSTPKKTNGSGRKASQAVLDQLARFEETVGGGFASTDGKLHKLVSGQGAMLEIQQGMSLSLKEIATNTAPKEELKEESDMDMMSLLIGAAIVAAFVALVVALRSRTNSQPATPVVPDPATQQGNGNGAATVAGIDCAANNSAEREAETLPPLPPDTVQSGFMDIMGPDGRRGWRTWRSSQAPSSLPLPALLTQEPAEVVATTTAADLQAKQARLHVVEADLAERNVAHELRAAELVTREEAVAACEQATQDAAAADKGGDK